MNTNVSSYETLFSESATSELAKVDAGITDAPKQGPGHGSGVWAPTGAT